MTADALARAPWTNEDCGIWMRVTRHWSGSVFECKAMRDLYHFADRYDAGLMRWREEYRLHARRGIVIRIDPPELLEINLRLGRHGAASD
jgi:hypothetical protein